MSCTHVPLSFRYRSVKMKKVKYEEKRFSCDWRRKVCDNCLKAYKTRQKIATVDDFGLRKSYAHITIKTYLSSKQLPCSIIYLVDYLMPSVHY